jgi:hypothetical protein
MGIEVWCQAEDAEMPKHWKRRLIFVLSTLALVTGLMVWWRWLPGRAFDPVAWQDEFQVEQGVRLKMADRLIAQQSLLGKTRVEVVELLGDPTPTGHFSDWDLVYWLGPERGFIRIDSEWLVLRLADDGRVVDNRIVRD